MHNKTKEVFGGKISDKYVGYIKGSLILFAVVLIAIGLLFFGIAIFGEEVEYSTRKILGIIGPVFVITGIGYPLITVHLIKMYPKHRKITKLLIVEYVFKDYYKFGE